MNQTIKNKNKFLVLMALFILLLSTFIYPESSRSKTTPSLAEELKEERLSKDAEERQAKAIKIRDQIKKKNCLQAKSRLEQLSIGGRIRITTENSTKILSDEEKKEEINAAKSAIKEFCIN